MSLDCSVGELAPEKIKKLKTVQCGVAGEYFVAAELSRRGYIASLNLKNTEGIDILASRQDGSRQIGIQVKTCQGDHATWMMSQKAESFYAENLFYIFVRLKSLSERPDFHVVPSKTVARYVAAKHKKWLGSPGKDGQQHKDTPMRKFSDKNQKYLDKWESLGL